METYLVRITYKADPEIDQIQVDYKLVMAESKDQARSKTWDYYKNLLPFTVQVLETII